MHAFTKNDMNPSLMPCFAWNGSWYFCRSAMTAVMSHSLNVVSIAAELCACSKRSAMRARSRVIATRCSERAGPPLGSGLRAGKPARPSTA